MSEAKRDWRLYLADMIEFAERALVYTEGLARHEFEESGLTHDATVRNLELIGEAATHIPKPIRQANPHIHPLAQDRWHAESLDPWLSRS